MGSALEHSVEFDFHIENALSILNSYRNSSCKFVLKTEQETAIKELLKGNDVLPTGFGKSIIFIVYLLAHSSFVEQTRGSSQSSVLVVSPLKSIICDQVLEVSLFNCSAMELSKETIHQITTSPPQFIYCSAENCINKDFLDMLKDDGSQLHKSVEAIVVDESHTIETWTGKW
ncbi:probable ATP-dependent DNA helicase [Paramuricea clavata]|uniref:Probable ATP-dependent DNA helicase n=1 Tax=Paramuricea clavata TaxID=317549 RepID=A0A6S7FH74_PARCT|nr:probable ATP-dependent DNA helicase [Paramuricea clavata]